MGWRRWKAAAGAWATLACCACGADSESAQRGPGGGNENPGTLGPCGRDLDCPSGLICVATRCVSPDDLMPPDVEERPASERPAASERHIFALSPDTDTVAVIDAATLAIEAVHVPADPVAVAVLPGSDACAALSRDGRALSLISAETSPPSVEVIKLPRRFSRVSVAPDASLAVAWTQALDTPDEGTEGLVAIVPFDGSAPVELAAGYRHTDILFRTRAGRVEAVVAVGKDETAVIDLARAAEAGYVPPRLRHPEGYTDVLGREVVSAPDARYVLMRSFAAPQLAALVVDTGTVATVPLPALATDLDVVGTGTLAVASLRATSQLALVRLPEALTSSAAVRLVDVGGTSAGQAELSPDTRFAAVFSTADASEHFAWVELATGRTRIFDRLRKRIRSIGIAPGGGHAVVIHRPVVTSSAADPYEREVDQDEGYSIVDLSRGLAQLKRTEHVPPLHLVFTTDGTHAVVTLRDDTRRIFRAEVADLATLVIQPRALASAPQFAGPLPGGGRVWITQVHPAGRISFLDTITGALRTATGYYLNAGIE